MDKQKRLQIFSRTGNFNLFKPHEEEVSCHIAVWDGDTKIMSTNLRLDYEVNPDIAYVEDAIQLLEDSMEHMFDTSRKEKEELLRFLKDNQEEIDEGSKKYRNKILKEKIEKIQRYIEMLSE